ncbi:MAG: hypothetical protein A2845_01600 [Candidatus Lloydbacteria bacterium RIFCSPHIGHO2_01_FULL_49_22]|uniref:Peptidoglycan binding-like domain-containing protein n=1 Tax=Candidatus Lloydbacteria bacterium RIFCSPHIGHO2_01_FULL_49_22 TaxID=1798658 RepID=A0A1G2CZN0_9BACT|nr:MAG: hypothetical protein A2845_01600 [Candidatus Lloydbacteria bacterium RIFCSPHIGHO2_01_FULL_49_22]OGZ09992.1 MAG: hypothetical protein A3C14_04765 [Candidatus Lloydbacteria bacterium RIFCSPHIGHO2_02_FULL_50_18]
MLGSNASAESAPSAFSAAELTFTRNLTVGARGSDVSALQQFLIAGGFLNIATPTGYFGALTRTALGKWQASMDIAPSVGFFGPISRAKLYITTTAVPISVIRIPDIIVGTTTAPTAGTTTIPMVDTNSGLPIRLNIPKLNVDANVQHNGLTQAGAMEIPNNIVDVGWFTGSAQPGEIGTAVMTGHVAQIRGGVLTKPGVFMNLRELRAGDRLSVTNDRGESFTYAVRESRLYDPNSDATTVFVSADGGAHLNIITCEGTWNPGQLSYSERLVVFTDAVR